MAHVFARFCLASGWGFAPWPLHQGFFPWTPLAAVPSLPHYGLVLRARHSPFPQPKIQTTPWTRSVVRPVCDSWASCQI